MAKRLSWRSLLLYCSENQIRPHSECSKGMQTSQSIKQESQGAREIIMTAVLNTILYITGVILFFVPEIYYKIIGKQMGSYFGMCWSGLSGIVIGLLFIIL
jgi:tetrahydromethanopterin S-methyltransferase subunit F